MYPNLRKIWGKYTLIMVLFYFMLIFVYVRLQIPHIKNTIIYSLQNPWNDLIKVNYIMGELDWFSRHNKNIYIIVL